MEQTIGEQRVRVEFNPSAEGIVDKIKQMSAELINICETLKAKDARLASLAQTAFEEAAMWGVKAATSNVAGSTFKNSSTTTIEKASEGASSGL